MSVVSTVYLDAFFALCALYKPIKVGTSEISKMATITNSKFFCTKSIFPKKYPRSVKSEDHIIPPRIENGVKRTQRIPDTPEINGMNVRINGKNLPKNTAKGPHFSIIASVLATRSGVRALTLPDSTILRPKKWPIK